MGFIKNLTCKVLLLTIPKSKKYKLDRYWHIYLKKHYEK